MEGGDLKMSVNMVFISRIYIICMSIFECVFNVFTQMVFVTERFLVVVLPGYGGNYWDFIKYLHRSMEEIV